MNTRLLTTARPFLALAKRSGSSSAVPRSSKVGAEVSGAIKDNTSSHSKTSSAFLAPPPSQTSEIRKQLSSAKQLLASRGGSVKEAKAHIEKALEMAQKIEESTTELSKQQKRALVETYIAKTRFLIYNDGFVQDRIANARGFLAKAVRLDPKNKDADYIITELNFTYGKPASANP